MTSASTDPDSRRNATPVLFLIFNRPDTTKKVFEAIRQARPTRLYVAADGARPSRAREAALCQETRAIVQMVDWPCEVKTLFRDRNLGCKVAVSEAISWFFQHETQGIVLEDDCLPAPSFFTFCDTMLERYADDDRIGQISGSSFFADEANLDGLESYIYSRYGSIWGWASWRRAWLNYDRDLADWEHMKDPMRLAAAFPDARERRYKLALGDRLHTGEIDTWDYQWGFAKAYQNQLSIVPTRNLILNIGFGADATHTTRKDSKAPKKLQDLEFPLIAPRYPIPNGHYDAIFSKRAYLSGWHREARTFLARIARTLSRNRSD